MDIRCKSSLLKEASIGGILSGALTQDVAVGGPFGTDYMGVDPSIMIKHSIGRVGIPLIVKS